MDHPQNRKIRLEEKVEGVFHRLVDAFYRRWPCPPPPLPLLKSCRIISHRGEHDNLSRVENTLPAFDAAAEAGVWGLELDVRWTRDLFPVVFHDPDTQRLCNQAVWIGRTRLDAIRNQFPWIPTLPEVIDRYGGRLHLMIEIKGEHYPTPSVQSRRMRDCLEDLAPGEDFHLMALQPDKFGYFGFLPANAFVGIARMRMDRLSRMAADHRWGGLAGHYLLTTKAMLARHHGLGQGVGTGFADSRRCLFREAARGVDWIFSNRAAEMQAICRQA
ncbi:glycerophosphodiester phosphodiesterase [Desulfosarcina sp.]|uniref:glycerophosphodiester phosphodiesterase n=1 Tax=Desulfosarcina sp. TaxID=2027861 RepID=UPI003970D1F5